MVASVTPSTAHVWKFVMPEVAHDEDLAVHGGGSSDRSVHCSEPSATAQRFLRIERGRGDGLVVLDALADIFARARKRRSMHAGVADDAEQPRRAPGSWTTSGRVASFAKASWTASSASKFHLGRL
jgi:hypothetical protein